MKAEFTVRKCTKNQKGAYLLTLDYKEKVMIFGEPKEVSRTVYLGGMPNEKAVGTVISEDTDNFYTKVYPAALVSKNDGSKEVMEIKDAMDQGLEYEKLDLTYIHAKSAMDRVSRN